MSVEITTSSLTRPLQQTFLPGFKGALMVCAAVAAAGLLATLIRGDERQPAGVAIGPAGTRHEP